MSKDKTKYNDKGEFHGYQEWYARNNELFIRTTYKNGSEIGYEEIHSGEIHEDCFTIFYIR